MPYIKQEVRDDLAAGMIPDIAGELNYAITQVCIKYLTGRDKLSYQHYNDVIGALESCKLEFYARAVRPYEDLKIKENGDVY